MFGKSLLVCCFLSLPWLVPGQATLNVDSIQQKMTLEPVVIKAKGKTSLATNSEKWDSQALEIYGLGSVADVLERESGVFVKSYGNGSLATTSIRGGSASQTAIIWNGFSLQSPMLGQLDFSLLPTSFIDEMTLEYGGNTSLRGSAAIGGVINLKNHSPQQKGISTSILSEIGSFGLWNQEVQFQFKKNKISGKTSFFHKQAKNNFTYQIREDLPVKEQTNAAINANGLLQELYWDFKPGHSLSLHAWLQESDREIPPTTTQRVSQAAQEDDFLRTALKYKWVGDKMSLKANAAYFNELLNYRDDMILLLSNSHYTIWTSEVIAERFFDKQRLLVGLHNTLAKANSDGYAETPREIRTAAYALLSGKIIEKLHYQISGRQQIVDKKIIKPTASISLEAKPLKWLTLTGKASRNYRLPTFNDRYWRPGGDPDLKPESGWSKELTARFEGKIRKRHHLKYSLTAFNRNIDNWILWSVNEGEHFYSANNITKVWSRGLENRLSYNTTIKKAKIRLSTGYDHIRSTNQVAVTRPKIDAGKQLIYTPIHQAFSTMGFTWNNLSATYQHRFTGKVRGQNIITLDGYHIGYLKANYRLNYKQFQGNIFFDLDNIWDSSYRILERRPMPGRSFKIGLSLNIFSIK